MSNPIDLSPQANFPLSNLPQNTADFYNSRAFAQGEVHFLGTAISIMQKELEIGLKQIEDAIKGVT
jgi:hypothetical protein